MLAVEANARSATPEAAATLGTLLARAAGPRKIVQRPAQSIAFSPDGGLLALGLDDRSIELFDSGSFRPHGAPLRLPDSESAPEAAGDGQAAVPAAWRPSRAPSWLAFTGYGKSLLASYPDQYHPPRYDLYHWNLAAAGGGAAQQVLAQRLVALSPLGRTAAFLEWGGGQRTRFWNAATASFAGPELAGRDATAIWVAFSSAPATRWSPVTTTASPSCGPG